MVRDRVRFRAWGVFPGAFFPRTVLVNKFDMILDNQGRLLLNDQKIPLPDEPQRSPGFVQKQPPEVFCRRKCS